MGESRGVSLRILNYSETTHFTSGNGTPQRFMIIGYGLKYAPTLRFPKMGAPPNHAELDHVCIETHGFGISHFRKHPNDKIWNGGMLSMCPMNMGAGIDRQRELANRMVAWFNAKELDLANQKVDKTLRTRNFLVMQSKWIYAFSRNST